MKHELPKYPKDHQVGMVVPKGGSSCAKCEFFDGSELCSEKHFIAWMGDTKSLAAGKSAVIPAPADEYCCDFFTTRELTKPRSAKELRKQK